jgi:hypothetical protein
VGNGLSSTFIQFYSFGLRRPSYISFSQILSPYGPAADRLFCIVLLTPYTSPWKTKVMEAKAFLAHLRRFFAQTKPLEFGRKKNVIILKSEIKWGLFFAHFLKDLTFSRYRIFPYYRRCHGRQPSGICPLAPTIYHPDK